jgi:hypothetical protein
MSCPSARSKRCDKQREISFAVAVAAAKSITANGEVIRLRAPNHVTEVPIVAQPIAERRLAVLLAGHPARCCREIWFRPCTESGCTKIMTKVVMVAAAPAAVDAQAVAVTAVA